MKAYVYYLILKKTYLYAVLNSLNIGDYIMKYSAYIFVL